MDGTFCFCVFLAIVFGVVHGSNAEDAVTNAELLSRIQALETEGKWMKQIIMEQKAELTGLRTVVETQQNTVEKQNKAIKDLQEWKQRRIEKDHSPNKNGSAEDTTVTSQKERTQTRISNNVTMDRRLVLGSEGTVAFNAVITKGAVSTLGVHQRIVFDVVQINLGGGYHNLHGLFIAPAPGLYIFSVSILSSEHNDGAITVSLMKNGAILAAAFGDGTNMSWDQGAVTAVTQLAAGDEVWVEHRNTGAAGSLWGDYFTSFMGCMVVPL